MAGEAYVSADNSRASLFFAMQTFLASSELCATCYGGPSVKCSRAVEYAGGRNPRAHRRNLVFPFQAAKTICNGHLGSVKVKCLFRSHVCGPAAPRPAPAKSAASGWARLAIRDGRAALPGGRKRPLLQPQGQSFSGPVGTGVGPCFGDLLLKGAVEKVSVPSQVPGHVCQDQGRVCQVEREWSTVGKSAHQISEGGNV